MPHHSPTMNDAGHNWRTASWQTPLWVACRCAPPHPARPASQAASPEGFLPAGWCLPTIILLLAAGVLSQPARDGAPADAMTTRPAPWRCKAMESRRDARQGRGQKKDFKMRNGVCMANQQNAKAHGDETLPNQHYCPKCFLPLIKTTDPRRIRGVLADRSGRIPTDPDGSASYAHHLWWVSVSLLQHSSCKEITRIHMKSVTSKQPRAPEMHGEEPESLSENVAFLNVFKILNNEKVMPSLYSGVKGFLELYVAPFPLRCFFLLRILRGFLSRHYGCSGGSGGSDGRGLRGKGVTGVQGIEGIQGAKCTTSPPQPLNKGV